MGSQASGNIVAYRALGNEWSILADLEQIDGNQCEHRVLINGISTNGNKGTW